MLLEVSKTRLIIRIKNKSCIFLFISQTYFDQFKLVLLSPLFFFFLQSERRQTFL